VLQSLDERRFIAKQKKKLHLLKRIHRGLIGSIILILNFEEATVLSHISVEKMEGMKEDC
jgi:hypothetical protein